MPPPHVCFVFGALVAVTIVRVSVWSCVCLALPDAGRRRTDAQPVIVVDRWRLATEGGDIRPVIIGEIACRADTKTIRQHGDQQHIAAAGKSMLGCGRASDTKEYSPTS
jgi:hypothetical protein